MLKERLRVGSTPVWGQDGESAFIVLSGMAVDADGAPHAYHPSNTGLDYLANAGHAGNWWGIVTDNDKSSGNPAVQGSGDPAPGYYVSATSLVDPAYSRLQQRRYVDSETIPYIVLPAEVTKATGIRLGDFVVVLNAKTGKRSYAIFADGGPRGKIGEGSIALATALGVPPSPKNGGTSSTIIFYLAFPGSGSRRPVPAAEVQTRGAEVLTAWGGEERLRQWQTAVPKPRGIGDSPDVRGPGPVQRPSPEELEGG